MPEFTLASDVSVERLAHRGQLLTSLDGGFAAALGRSAFDTMNRFQQRALDVLTSETVRNAFRLDKETDAARDSYGRNIYGQSVLLARRLIEAGTRVVTISWAPDANATWDTHGGNFKKLKGTLLPQFDAACGTLLRRPGRPRPPGADAGGGDRRLRPHARRSTATTAAATTGTGATR